MSDLKNFTIFPGQYMITTVPALINTILGSCVSVCLWDGQNAVGGMNHYLLPGPNVDNVADSNRGITSIKVMIEAMMNRNVSVQNLEAKIFGGCNSLYRDNDLFKVGERNIAMAFEVLKGYGIPVVAHHTGGAQGRKIIFNTGTGKVRMKLLNQSAVEINEKINKGFNY